MWDSIQMTNGVVVTKILQTPYSLVFVKIICLLGITLRRGDTAMNSGVNIGDQLVEVQSKNEIYE